MESKNALKTGKAKRNKMEYEVTMEAKTTFYINAESEEEATEKAYDIIWEEWDSSIKNFEVTDVAIME